MSGASSTAAVLSDADLLREILLRVQPATDLVPASAVCRAWRRTIRSPLFWRLFAAVRPPPLLGFFHNCDYANRPPFVPALPSPPLPRALLDGADFNLDPLDGEAWEIRDSRDGLLLLFRPEIPPLELVVVNPLTSVCFYLPPPSATGSGTDEERFLSSVFQHEEYLFDAALITDGHTGGVLQSEVRFRVVLVVACYHDLVVGAWVLSSEDYCWSLVGYADLPVKPWFPGVVMVPSFNCLFYWINRGDYVLRIDFDSKRLTILHLSEEMLQRCGSNFELVGTEEDIALLGACGKELHLWVHTLNRWGHEGWVLRKKFDLQRVINEQIKARTSEPGGTLLHLEGIGERAGLVFVRVVDEMFSLHLKAERLEKLSDLASSNNCKGFSSFPYMMAWPPFSMDDQEIDA